MLPSRLPAMRCNGGVADHWSPPFETLQTHRGNCEDYAIVKYVALLQAGLSHDDVKIVILRNLLRKEDHAAEAARVDGQWLILDTTAASRWCAIRRWSDPSQNSCSMRTARGSFVPSNRAGQGPSAGRSGPARFARPA
jgi:predicted transglutaminase-like cysteine proteinase